MKKKTFFDDFYEEIKTKKKVYIYIYNIGTKKNYIKRNHASVYLGN